MYNDTNRRIARHHNQGQGSKGLVDQQDKRNMKTNGAGYIVTFLFPWTDSKKYLQLSQRIHTVCYMALCFNDNRVNGTPSFDFSIVGRSWWIRRVSLSIRISRHLALLRQLFQKAHYSGDKFGGYWENSRQLWASKQILDLKYKKCYMHCNIYMNLIGCGQASWIVWNMKMIFQRRTNIKE